MEEKEKPFVFEMTDVESDRVRAFIKKHGPCPCRVAEKFGVKFIPSMMGLFCYVRCMGCGEEEEVTEIEKF